MCAMVINEHLHGIGTMLDLGGVTHMVCGYRFINTEQKVGLAYVVVPYPFGYVDSESVSLIDSRKAHPVVSEGFGSESLEMLLNVLDKAREEGEHTNFDEYAQGMQAIMQQRTEVEL